MDYNILIRLLVAHFLSDFVFQSTKGANEKDSNGYKTSYLYWHTLITGAIAMVMVWDINLWLPITLITLIHGLTDGIKVEVNKRYFNLSPPQYLFVIDQLIHLLTIVLTWLIVTNQFNALFTELSQIFQNQIFWYYLLGYTFVSSPLSFVIDKITKRWKKELNSNTSSPPSNEDNTNGLQKAGKWIGIIERIMILTFVLSHQFGAIGFMLAAKSVFRFGDLKENKDHKKTEYIIIGTFLSFLTSIFTGMAINYIAV